LNGFLDNGSVGWKQPRDDKNEDFTSSESGILSTRNKAGHPKRRRTVLIHGSEESNLDDENEISKIPGPSSGNPK